MTMQIIILCLSLLVSVVALLPALNCQHWVVRGADFPRLQLLTLLVLITTVHLLFFETNIWIIAIALLAIVYELRWIVPYTIFYPVQVNSVSESEKINPALKILSSNVLMSNTEHQKLIALVKSKDPDVLITLESDINWQNSLDELDQSYPFSFKHPMDNRYGIHVYSKLELRNAQVKYLVEEDVPSLHFAIPLADGKEARVHIMHPSPPSPTESEKSTERDAELLLLAKDLADEDDPVIVAGDLNDVAWSKTTQTFLGVSKLLDPRVGRGLFNTFHADFWFMRWPLDHLFHSQHFKVRKLEILKHIGSDHFPLWCELHYIGEKQMPERELINSEGKEWANERITKGHAKNKSIPDPTETSQ